MTHRLATTALALFVASAVPGLAQNANAGDNAAQTTGAGKTVDVGGSQTVAAQTNGGANGDCLSYSSTDANGDGTITRDEWAAWRQNGFGTLDVDGNGEISRDEYIGCFGTGMQGGYAESDRTAGNMADVDTNGDGSISADEYRTAAQDAQHKAGTPDGMILLHRFILVPAIVTDEDVAKMGAPEAAVRSAQMFRTLDTDNNGKLSRDEWTVHGSMQADLSKDAGASFDQMDADGSGTLSKDEFIKAGDMQFNSASKAADAAGDGGKDSGVAPFHLFFTVPADRSHS